MERNEVVVQLNKVEEKKKAYRLLKYEGGESLTMKKLKNITRRQYLNQP